MRVGVACTFLLAGCSLAFVDGPKPAAPTRCTTSRLAPTSDVVVGLATVSVGGLYLLGAGFDGAGLSAGGGGGPASDANRERWGKIGLGLTLPGVVVTGVGLWGFKTTKECANNQQYSVAMRNSVDMPDRTRAAAQLLTTQARFSAHANDCPRVVQLAQQVFALDRSVFETEFARDPIIMTCAPKRPELPPRGDPPPPAIQSP